MGLSRADNIAVAKLTGIAARHASGAEARNAAELHEQPADPVAELHAVSQDVRLLSVAAAMYVSDSAHWYAAEAAELLRQAGANLDEARQWRAEHPPHGFTPPQAERTYDADP